MSEKERLTENVGRWLSAALEDPQVCAEMKADILAWMEGGKPNIQPSPSASAGPQTEAGAKTHSQRSELDDAGNACLEFASKHGYATGHGDTVADMIREFSAQIPAHPQPQQADGRSKTK